jgi:hypothetical protein
MSHASPPVYPPRVFFHKEIRHLLDDAAAGIRRSQRVIARTANYLEIAQRFLVEGHGGRARVSTDPVVARPASPASPAFAHELDSLRSLLKRVGAQVADERTDLGMEAAELARLTVALQHEAVK